MKKYLLVIFIIITASLWFLASRPVKKVGGRELTLANYTKEKSAFLKTTGDRKTEIGDKTKDTFTPEMKLSKWDEVNLKVKYDGSKIKVKGVMEKLFGGAEPTVTTEGDKMVYNDGINEVKYYELPASKENPEGAYEMEVVLKEKPDTNVLSFTIETANLDFFYQPALTEQERTDGASRPDNVTGSYAGYYKDTPANIVGGKEYKTGKAFHIFRPVVTDSKGDWVWGELNVDTDRSVLTITIDQAFLDKAVYPISIL